MLTEWPENGLLLIDEITLDENDKNVGYRLSPGTDDSVRPEEERDASAWAMAVCRVAGALCRGKAVTVEWLRPAGDAGPPSRAGERFLRVCIVAGSDIYKWYRAERDAPGRRYAPYYTVLPEHAHLFTVRDIDPLLMVPLLQQEQKRSDASREQIIAALEEALRVAKAMS